MREAWSIEKGGSSLPQTPLLASTSLPLLPCFSIHPSPSFRPLTCHSLHLATHLIPISLASLTYLSLTTPRYASDTHLPRFAHLPATPLAYVPAHQPPFPRDTPSVNTVTTTYTYLHSRQLRLGVVRRSRSVSSRELGDDCPNRAGHVVLYV